MPPRGSANYNSGIGDWRYDPRLAEEFAAKQERSNAARLAQLAEEGDIAAAGAERMGDIASEGIKGAAQAYHQGQQRRMDQDAHQRRMELSEEELNGSRAENQWLDAPSSDVPGSPTNRTRLLQLKGQKAEEEVNILKAGKGKPKTFSPTNATSGGKPLRFNQETGQYEPAGDLVIDKKPDKSASLTPFQTEMLRRGEERDKQREADRTERQTIRKDEVMDKATTKYSDTLQKTNIPTAVAQLERIYSLMPPKGDVPGYGMVEGALPDSTPRVAGIGVGDEGRQLRQGVATLFNIELKDRSGTAVQDSELQRLKDEFGSGSWKNEAQLRNGIAQYEARLKQVIQNIDAGVDPGARQEYVTRGGRDFTTFKGRGFPGDAGDGTATAATLKKAPVAKAPEDMTPDERAAELSRLRGR